MVAYSLNLFYINFRDQMWTMSSSRRANAITILVARAIGRQLGEWDTLMALRYNNEAKKQ